MNAKLGILYCGNFLETICWEILGNYMLGNSWKQYAGKFGWMPENEVQQASEVIGSVEQGMGMQNQ